MTHIKITFIILFLIFSCSLSKSQKIEHTGILTFTDNKIEDGPANTWLLVVQPKVTYYISYRLSSLFGESTVFCQSAVILNPGNTAGSKNMEKLLKKVRVRYINLFGAFGSKSKYIIDCDVGVPAKPFIGSPQEYRQLSREQKKQYSSFNVTGSPNWESFIHKTQGFTSLASPTGILMGFNDITAPDNYVSPNKAKELYTDQKFKFKEYSHYGTGSGSFIEVAWDFYGLERYFAEQKRNKTEEKIADAEGKIDKIEKRAREKAKNNTSGDFWDQPDNAITKYNKNKIDETAKRLKDFKKEGQSLDREIDAIQKKINNTENYLSRKRSKLKSQASVKEKIKNNLVRSNEDYLGFVEVQGKYIFLETWDHGIEDGDRVSIFINSKSIERNFTLEKKVSKIRVNLDDIQNKISFKALNEGSASPNTASFIVRDRRGNILTENEWDLNTGDEAVILVIKIY